MEKQGFGFLYELLQTDCHKHIMNSVKKLRGSVTEQKWDGINSRLIMTSSIVYGGFSALCKIVDIKDLFANVGSPNTKKVMLNEIKNMLNKAQKLTEEQGILDIFFSIFHTIYLQGKIEGFVEMVTNKDVPSGIRFSLDPVLNEVLSYDRRNRNYLEGVKRGDIETRIRERFNVSSDPEKKYGQDVNFFTLPLNEMREDYGVSFMKIERDDRDIKPDFDRPVKTEEVVDTGSVPF